MNIKTFRGASHPGSKLTDEQVALIRDLHRQGVSCVRIAKELGMNSTTIWRIVNRKTWRHS